MGSEIVDAVNLFIPCPQSNAWLNSNIELKMIITNDFRWLSLAIGNHQYNDETSNHPTLSCKRVVVLPNVDQFYDVLAVNFKTPLLETLCMLYCESATLGYGLHKPQRFDLLINTATKKE